MKNISTQKERILQVIDYKGDSKSKFYQKTGISNGVLDKKSGITGETIEKFISKYNDINTEWLLTGNGEMLKKENPTNLPSNTSKLIPLVSMSAAAGFGNANFTITSDDIQAQYQVPDFNDIDFMIRVKGNSMYPKYSSGDVIACRILKESQFIEWNKPHLIATTEHGLIVKRLRKSEKENCLQAISDNKEYDPFEIPRAEITGIALIIGVIRLE